MQFQGLNRRRSRVSEECFSAVGAKAGRFSQTLAGLAG
jgi:hypothetical protein